MPLRIEFSPEDLQPLIERTVEAAMRRLLAERPADERERVLLNKQETAKSLGVSASTVDRLRRTAGLPFVKLVGGLVLFRPEALRQWAAEQEARNHDEKN